MRKLRPSKAIDIPSDQVITLDRGTKVPRAEVYVLIRQGYVVRFQPAWAAQCKAPDEKRPSSVVRRPAGTTECAIS